MVGVVLELDRICMATSASCGEEYHACLVCQVGLAGDAGLHCKRWRPTKLGLEQPRPDSAVEAGILYPDAGC